jgi:hypothetical protein
MQSDEGFLLEHPHNVNLSFESAWSGGISFVGITIVIN